MKFRSNPLPQTLVEYFFFFLISGLLPLSFVYEIVYVLPKVHEPGSRLYNFTICMGLFILSNIEGNLIACMIIDTSVDCEYKQINKY